jgi:hypothetical protein
MPAIDGGGEGLGGGQGQCLRPRPAARCGSAGEVADGFALLDLAEAVALREAGIRQPILLLEGFFEAADLAVCAEHDLTVVIHRLEQLQMLRQAALPRRLSIYLKLEQRHESPRSDRRTSLPAAQARTGGDGCGGGSAR